MERTLREWAPLTDLFSKLPSKIQHGIFTPNLKLTCVDVLPEFLALGTNFGLVFWYDRKKKTIEKLQTENKNSPTTAVKVISTVDYMVACGNHNGNISIFQVPKSPPEALPESLKPKNKQIERYLVTDLHKSPITALEWSKNGMKLFSGDKSGNVILTEIDFYMHLCKSVEILNESYEVVQLNFYQQMLLVSTTYRSIICKKEEKWKVSQIGKKDRKILGGFGGIIHPKSLCPNDATIYCTRPGLRIWESDLQGNVLKTLRFKEILTQQTPEIEIINPISEKMWKKKSEKDKSFGLVSSLNEESLVIYNNDFLFVVNPKTVVIEAILSNLRNIISVGVYKNEIFVLEGERSLIRLSYFPEPTEGKSSYFLAGKLKEGTILKPLSPVPLANTFMPFKSSLKELSAKIQEQVNIVASLPSLSGPIGGLGYTEIDQIVMKAEEARESPEKETCSSDYLTKKIDETYKKLERLHKAINTLENENDNILYKHVRHKKSTDTSVGESNPSDDFEGTISAPVVMNISTVGILPDLRSPEAIKIDIENKEKILADILYSNTVNISEEALKPCEEDEKKDAAKDEVATSEMPKNEESKVDEEAEDSDDGIEVISSEREMLAATESLPKSIISYLNKMNSPPRSSKSMERSLEQEDSTMNKTAPTVPDCVEIPHEWKLKGIKVKEDEESSPDTSLRDWELL